MLVHLEGALANERALATAARSPYLSSADCHGQLVANLVAATRLGAHPGLVGALGFADVGSVPAPLWRPTSA